MAFSNSNGVLPPSLISAPNRPIQRNSWAPQTDYDQSNGYTPMTAPSSPNLHTHPSNLPDGPRSLSGISLRAALLGLTFGVSISLTLLLAYLRQPIWRAPFFIATLALFHFLEFFVTARFNPGAAIISAFLLSQNGWAYNAAHSLAFLECVVMHTYLRNWYFASEEARGLLLGTGLTMLLLGQVVRSTAMVQAGSNFNHTVQREKASSHELVTGGIYRWLRHPSYFGFFWWGLGTQVTLGNIFCFMGYAVVLWKFFQDRIQSEFPACALRDAGE